MFSNTKDHQLVVSIRICEGESRKLAENVLLGDLLLEGLPPRLRGETRVSVTFHIDASGILNVRAVDLGTGAEQRASVTPARRTVAGPRWSPLGSASKRCSPDERPKP